MSLDIPVAVRQAVYERDGRKCRWCGRHNVAMHVHHITYRSEGGKHTMENLILLCHAHHDEAHSSKEKYQHLLHELITLEPSVTLLQHMRWKTQQERRPALTLQDKPENETGRAVGRLLAID